MEMWGAWFYGHVTTSRMNVILEHCVVEVESVLSLLSGPSVARDGRSRAAMDGVFCVSRKERQHTLNGRQRLN